MSAAYCMSRNTADLPVGTPEVVLQNSFEFRHYANFDNAFLAALEREAKEHTHIVTEGMDPAKMFVDAAPCLICVSNCGCKNFFTNTAIDYRLKSVCTAVNDVLDGSGSQGNIKSPMQDLLNPAYADSSNRTKGYDERLKVFSVLLIRLEFCRKGTVQVIAFVTWTA